MAAIRRASTVLRSQKPVMVKRKQTHLELLSRALSQSNKDVSLLGGGRGAGGGERKGETRKRRRQELRGHSDFLTPWRCRVQGRS